ncbi:glycosyltransferase family 4 protein [Amnibacterium flavum]|uniref:Mannosyltransferase n=1 Tax=Amnibacterium flavum TaxID=2173173 RepID=A0A2V1HTS7_9MICO|nr:glycosyltransferase family 1 protein [Amnibacterium flavum]PVZ94449.1 mannosyltransferase [Amnibacterium flavum]
MKIFFDCRYVKTDGSHDGIARYSERLVASLGAGHDVTMLINDERQLAVLPDLPWKRISSPTSPLEILVAREVNKLKPDVVFSPMQTMGSFGRRYPLVLTLHDLIYYRHRTPPRSMPTWLRLLWRIYHLAWWPQRLLLNGADAVVTVSETTKGLMEEHRLTRRPIEVVYNAADGATVGAGTGTRTRPDGGVLVYMGAFIGYKNVEALVRAAARLPGYELHLLSRVSDADRRRLTALAPDARLVFHNGVTDEEYAEILSRATALLTASLDEGFGIPVIEAMRAGTPAVVSDIPIFREIGGDAAIYVDPHDDASIVDGIRSLEDPDAWKTRSVAGVTQASKFSWTASAEVLNALLERVATRPH